jgi:hypothetical protein
MDTIIEKVIGAIIGVLLTATVGGVPMYMYYNRRIENLVTEKMDLVYKLNKTQEMVSHLSEQKKLNETKFQNLQNQYDDIKPKWDAIQGHNPSFFHYNWQDSDWREEEVSANDTIKFNFVSLFSVDVGMHRISSDGPIVSLSGCEHPKIIEGVTSAETKENSFLINKGRTLRLLLSKSICSDSGVQRSAKSIEELIIRCVNFDCEKQVATLQFRISPHGGGNG